MSSSDSEDSYDHEDYYRKYCSCDERAPPLIKKKSRLISAAAHDQLEIFSDLLDSPKWNNVRDVNGNNLLQIAVIQESIEVFDYLLSIPDFPLEFKNKEGETALGLALDHARYNDIWRDEYITYELIKKGACIDEVCFEGDSPLHRALERHYYKSAKLLIERGADVNFVTSCHRTPLDITVRIRQSELVMTLLAYGAQPAVCHFEWSVLYNNSFEAQETLFLYIYDQYSNLELCLDVLLKLAEAKSPLFYHIIECPIKITVQYESLCLYFRLLCSMNVDCLHLIIKKFGHFINEVFSKHILSDSYCTGGKGKPISLENLNIMLKSELKPTVITFINSVNSSEIFQDLIALGYDETAITQLYCYLLSYGLNIGELDLQIIYKKFGYCELFKILLHMDVQMGVPQRYTKNIVPVFAYDVNMNLERFLQQRSHYCANSIKLLRHYFVHPKLNDETDGYSEKQSSQEMPLLIELARNVFRKFFINKFKIKTCKEFYSRLNGLPISNIHKKIITYETILY